MTATRSFSVVISGPDATAGSILSFFRASGITVPVILERKTEINNATPVQEETKNAKAGG